MENGLIRPQNSIWNLHETGEQKAHHHITLFEWMYTITNCMQKGENLVLMGSDASFSIMPWNYTPIIWRSTTWLKSCVCTIPSLKNGVNGPNFCQITNIYITFVHFCTTFRFLGVLELVLPSKTILKRSNCWILRYEAH